MEEYYITYNDYFGFLRCRKKSTETAKSYLPDQSRIVIENALN